MAGTPGHLAYQNGWRVESIDGAELSVDLLTFVYWTGDIARDFAESLASAARRGVRTRVLLDRVGWPEATLDEVRGIFRLSHTARVPVTFRAAGTSLNGQSQTDGLLVDVLQLDPDVDLSSGGGVVGGSCAEAGT